MTEKKEIVRCHIKTFSPVHIGCDEVYEPMGFVIDEAQHQLIIIDPFSFFQQMSTAERQKFTAICRQGTIPSLLEIYKFLRGRKASGKVVELCPGLVKHYQQTVSISIGDVKKIQKELNNFTITRTAFLTHDGRPYIPGSAIKGALRTAYLNSQQKIKNLPKGGEKASSRELEKDLLDGGSFETDPFRMLKVSDFLPVGEVKTRVVYAVNEKKKLSKFEARGPYQILEVVEPGAVFTGWLSLEVPEAAARIKTPLTRRSLFTGLSSFYHGEKTREDGELLNIGVKKVAVTAPENGFLLRLGRHSGAESVTIEGHRHIRIMQGKGQPAMFLDQATTLWLAANQAKPTQKETLLPFGWAVVEELAPGLEKLYDETEAFWREQMDQKVARLTPGSLAKEEVAKPEAGAAQLIAIPAPSTGPSSKLRDLLGRLKTTKPHDAGRVALFLDGRQALEEEGEKRTLARAVLDHFDRKTLKRHKRWAELEPYQE